MDREMVVLQLIHAMELFDRARVRLNQSYDLNNLQSKAEILGRFAEALAEDVELVDSLVMEARMELASAEDMLQDLIDRLGAAEDPTTPEEPEDPGIPEEPAPGLPKHVDGYEGFDYVDPSRGRVFEMLGHDWLVRNPERIVTARQDGREFITIEPAHSNDTLLVIPEPYRTRGLMKWQFRVNEGFLAGRASGQHGFNLANVVLSFSNRSPEEPAMLRADFSDLGWRPRIVWHSRKNGAQLWDGREPVTSLNRSIVANKWHTMKWGWAFRAGNRVEFSMQIDDAPPVLASLKLNPLVTEPFKYWGSGHIERTDGARAVLDMTAPEFITS